jgi:hypothetical protein
MKPTKSGKSKPSAKRSLKDLTPKKTSVVKGGKKSLIGNFPR